MVRSITAKPGQSFPERIKFELDFSILTDWLLTSVLCFLIEELKIQNKIDSKIEFWLD